MINKTILKVTILIFFTLFSINANANFYNEVLKLDYKGYWVLIDSDTNKLYLYKDREKVKELYASVGKSGSSFLRFMGDNKTPKGEFNINLFNPNSQFRKFFRIDYPRPKHIQKALNENLITKKEFDNYWRYKDRYGYPPQLTSLGGQIGIHGVGNRDPWIHKKVNWTEGCVAVTDKEIDNLSKYIGIGTKVVII